MEKKTSIIKCIVPKYWLLTMKRMPTMTGFQLTKKLKMINPDLKVILVSGFDIEQREFSKVQPSTLVDDFVTKPVSIEKIKQVLIKHLGNRAARKLMRDAVVDVKHGLQQHYLSLNCHCMNSKCRHEAAQECLDAGCKCCDMEDAFTLVVKQNDW